MTVLFLGFINWIATTIIVESELCRPVREYCERKRKWFDIEKNRPRTPQEEPVLWRKLHYLVQCHLCTGTWVALVEAAAFGGPFHGVTGYFANALLYKAVGHLVLELRPQAWYK